MKETYYVITIIICVVVILFEVGRIKDILKISRETGSVPLIKLWFRPVFFAILVLVSAVIALNRA